VAFPVCVRSCEQYTVTRIIPCKGSDGVIYPDSRCSGTKEESKICPASDCAKPNVEGLVLYSQVDNTLEAVVGQKGSGGSGYTTGKYGFALSINSNSVQFSGDSLNVDDVTMSAWIYPTSYACSGDRCIIMNKEGVYEMGLEKGTGNFQAAASGCWRWAGTVKIELNKWTHVAVTYGAGGEKHYVNGVLKETFTCPQTPKKNTNYLGVGARGNPAWSFFIGGVDEVQVYNKELSQAEITAVFSFVPKGASFVAGPTCEGARMEISCSERKLVSIKDASYGRTDGFTCPHSAMSNQNCHATTSLDKVKAACDGKPSCSIDSSNSVFGDPCGGTYKYLTASYVCV
jgi:hypothetical protein